MTIYLYKTKNWMEFDRFYFGPSQDFERKLHTNIWSDVGILGRWVIWRILHQIKPTALG